MEVWMSMDDIPNPHPQFRNSTHEQYDRGHKGPRKGAGDRRLRRRERWAAARVDVEIGDTSEEAVNINETSTEPVEEIDPAENAENTEKLGNTIMVS